MHTFWTGLFAFDLGLYVHAISMACEAFSPFCHLKKKKIIPVSLAVLFPSILIQPGMAETFEFLPVRLSLTIVFKIVCLIPFVYFSDW